MVDDSPENIARIRRALAILPDNAVAEVADLDVRSYQVVRVIDEVIIDLMGRACGLTYMDVIADAEMVDLMGVRTPVASPATLIRTKDPMRPQDAIDRAFLQALVRDRARSVWTAQQLGTPAKAPGARHFRASTAIRPSSAAAQYTALLHRKLRVTSLTGITTSVNPRAIRAERNRRASPRLRRRRWSPARSRARA